MLDAGLAKAFRAQSAPAVIHSHDYAPLDLFRRCFDEWRGLREIAPATLESGRMADGARTAS